MKSTDHFVTVPKTTLPGGLFVPEFKIGQYSTGRDAAGNLAINAGATPMVRIHYSDANKAAEAAGYKLVRESQYLALAYQIAAQDENWTGGKVGSGKLFQGIRKGRLSSAQSGLYVPGDADERRWFLLPTGEKIFDVAGNAYSWVFDDIQGDDKGLIAKPFADNSPSIVIPYPTEDKGQGWTPVAGRDWSGCALIRGGFWRSASSAGAFVLGYDWPEGESGGVGFRCTK